MRAYLEILKTIQKIYVKKFINYFDSKLKRIAFIGVMILVFIAVVITGNVLSSEIVDLFLNGKTSVLYSATITYLVGESTLVIVLFILLKYTSSETSNILKVIKGLPVSNWIKFLGYYSIQVLVNIIIPPILYIIILIPKVIMSGIKSEIVFLLIFMFIAQSIFITSICNFTYNSLLFFANKLKIPFARGIVLLAQLFAFLIYLYCQISTFEILLLDYGSFHNNILTWFSGIVGSILNGSQYKIFYIMFWLCPVLSVLFSVASFQLLSNIESEIEYSRALHTIKQPHNSFFNYLIKDVKLLIRSENVAFLLILFFVSLIGISILNINMKMRIVIIKIMSSLISSIALFSYGLDSKHLVLYKFLGQTKKEFICSKILSSLIISFSAVSILFLTNLNYFIHVVPVMMVIILTTAISFSLGVFFPFSEEGSFSQINVSIAVFFAIFPVSYLMNMINSFSSIEQIIIYICIILFWGILTMNSFNKNWTYPH